MAPPAIVISGVNASLTLRSSMGELAFESSGLPAVLAALSGLLGEDGSLIRVVRTYSQAATAALAAAQGPDRRRLLQAAPAATGGPAMLGLDLSLASASPMQLFSIAWSALAPNGSFDAAAAQFGISQAAPARLLAYSDGMVLSGPTVVSAATSAAPAATNSGATVASSGSVPGGSVPGGSVPGGSGLSAGAVVGIVLGACAGVALLATAALLLLRKRSRQRQLAAWEPAGATAVISTAAVAEAKTPGRADMA